MMRRLAVAFLTLSSLSTVGAIVSTGLAHTHVKADSEPPASVKSPSRDASLKETVATFYHKVWATLDDGIHSVAERAHTVNFLSLTQPQQAPPQPVQTGYFPKETTAQKIARICVDIFVTLLIACTVSILYIKYKPADIVTVTETDTPESLDGDFKYPLFHCCDLPKLSCFACLCQGFRWADTMRMIGELSFVSAFGIFIGVQIVCKLLSFGTGADVLIGGVIITVLQTYYRQKIRALFKMESDNQTMAMDCLKYFFCCFCTAVQDARQVEEAKMVKHEAVKNEMPFPELPF